MKIIFLDRALIKGGAIDPIKVPYVVVEDGTAWKEPNIGLYEIGMEYPIGRSSRRYRSKDQSPRLFCWPLDTE